MGLCFQNWPYQIQPGLRLALCSLTAQGPFLEGPQGRPSPAWAWQSYSTGQSLPGKGSMPSSKGFCLFYLFAFSGPLPWHMEVPQLGVESELQSPASTTATATPDPSRVCDQHHSSRQRQILNPRSEARDRTHNLMVPVAFTSALLRRELQKAFVFKTLVLIEKPQTAQLQVFLTNLCVLRMGIWLVRSSVRRLLI